MITVDFKCILMIDSIDIICFLKLQYFIPVVYPDFYYRCIRQWLW